ncbi:MAG: LuxR C-terminal-related transcriptional regulator [Anaerolineae bacterium]|jgi:DNA-binding CsgD family transcriptional regulator/N-acetylneuraminic acid mutarotase
MAERGEPLSDREKEVLELVATGITNREVAQELYISANTVKVHLRNIYAKLGAESRTEATVIAVREGWVSLGADADALSGGMGADEDASVALAADPPLPWAKRVALVVALLLAVSAIVVTWPSAEPQASRPDLPLDSSQAPPVVASIQDSESPWEERAQMPTRRAHLALTAVRDQLLAIGGQTRDGVAAAVEAYEPESDTWTPLSDKPTPLAYVGAATLGTEVYVPGGCDADNAPTRVVEVYDVVGDTWRQASPLPEPRCAYALAARGGKLFLFGGWDGAQYVSTAYSYDPGAEAWSELPPMSLARGFAGAASLSDQLYVVGGYDGERELRACASYDTVSGAWTECAPLAIGRGGLGLAAVGGQLYAIGGGGWTSYLGFNERYNPTHDRWSAIETPLVGEWRNPGVAVSGATIYAVGGWSSDYLSLNEAYEALPFRIFIPVSQQ